MSTLAKNRRTALHRAAESIRNADVPLQRLEERFGCESKDDKTLQACLAAIESARLSLRELSDELRSFMPAD